jgi:Spy/CpxP family protein refolding chaperone
MTAFASLGQVKLRAIALLAAMFLAGALAGAGLGRLLEPRGGPHPPGMGPYARLGLTPEQQARARAIFEAHRGELDAILSEAMPRVRKVQDSIDLEMREVLTPEQRDRLARLQAESPPGMPGMPGMGPPPDGPPPGPPPRMPPAGGSPLGPPPAPPPAPR